MARAIEKGATYLDKLCHKFYDHPKGHGEKTDYVCRICGGPLEICYCEERLYLVQCADCGTFSLVKTANPEDAARVTLARPTLTPPNEWARVEEKKPKYNIREDGELVSSKILCYCETDKTVHLAVSQKFYTARKGEIVHPVFRYYDEWGDEIEDVSHWMPLPAPPEKEDKK